MRIVEVTMVCGTKYNVGVKGESEEDILGRFVERKYSVHIFNDEAILINTDNVAMLRIKKKEN